HRRKSCRSSCETSLFWLEKAAPVYTHPACLQHCESILSGGDLCNAGQRYLKLAPDVAELVEPGFPRQPLGGAHGAFAESAARLGVVAQIDSIASGIEDHLMHADRVALAKGNDLEFLASAFAHNLLDGDGSSGRSVFFLRMMTLENLARVIVFQGGRAGCDNLEEQVHPDGKIRPVEEARLCGEHHFAQARQLFVPTGGSDDEVLSGEDAGLGVGHDRGGRGEVDGHVEGGKESGTEGRGISVFVDVQGADIVAARVRNFGDHRTHFAAPENQEVHGETFNRRNTEGAEKNLENKCLARVLGFLRVLGVSAVKNHFTQTLPDRLRRKMRGAGAGLPRPRRLLQSRKSD